MSPSGGNFVKNSNSLSSHTYYTAIGQPFMELTVTDSTNIHAMTHIQHNLAAHGSVFFAHEQVAGKGQHGKQWFTEPGQNIIMSLILKPYPLALHQQFHLSVAVALATFDLFSRYAGDETCIKWPNDIYWRDRKAGGILIENQLKGQEWTWAVVGIGININQVNFGEGINRPVSLKQITGKDHAPIQLSRELCTCIAKRLEELHQQGFNHLLSQYNQLLFKRNEQVQLKKNNTRFSRTIKAVNPQGQLVTDQEVWEVGGVEWVI